MLSAEHSSVSFRQLRERILREWRRDWGELKTGLDLKEITNLLCGWLSLQKSRLDDELGRQMEDCLCNFNTSGDASQRQHFLTSFVLQVEPYLKRVLALCDPRRWEALHKPPPDFRCSVYNPTFKDICEPSGFDFFKSGPQRISTACGNMRNLRNHLAHGGRQDVNPSLSNVEMSQGILDCLLVMLWATYKYRREIGYLLCVEPMRGYLQQLREKWQADLQRWILLDAGELQTDLLELTAGEEMFPAFEEENDGAQLAHDEEEEEEVDEFTKSDEAATRPTRRGHVHDLFRDVGRLVLVANAGAGKTVSLRHFAYKEASQLLDRQFRPIPLYVELRYYKGDLWQQLADATGIPQGELRRQMAEGKWCLLLDGLNEVRSECLEQAYRELEELLQVFGRTPAVVSSRFDTRLARFRLPIFRLDLLTDEQIEEFISKHFDESGKARTFVSTLRRHKALWEWGRNPLQLWMLVQVGLRTRGGIPDNRGLLLRRFVEYIFKREEAKDVQADRLVKENLLTELAYQTRQAGEVSFSYERALRMLWNRCQEMGYGVDTSQFVREVCDNHLLIQQGEQLAFAHEMYQEYFAALGLKKRYEKNPEIIEPLQNMPQWREPIVLLYGLLESATDLFKRVVRDAPQVAAECVRSTATPDQAQIQQLRERITQLDYGQATDVELASVLEAIYTLGDGQALATHLLEREKRKLLRGLGKQISSAFTAEEPAAEATLAALEHLGVVAKRFADVLLTPFLSRPVKISRQMSERAEKLAQEWKRSGFSWVHLVRLAHAYRMPELATDGIKKLIQGNQVVQALDFIRKFGGLQEQFPPAPLIEKLLAAGQVHQALEHIHQFQLQEQFPPAQIYALLIEGGHEKAAANFASEVIYDVLRSAVDRTTVAPLLERLGFRDDQVTHNLQLVDRIERANTSLAASGQLPPGETLDDIELFGWVMDKEWLLVPGFRDSRLQPEQQVEAGQIVRFRLYVCKHPTRDILVLNAVGVTLT